MKSIILIYSIIYAVAAEEDFLNKVQLCKLSDPELNACLKSSIQKILPYIEHGVQEYKIPSMQPIELSSWTIKPSVLIPFEQNYENIKLYNTASAKIDDVQSSITEKDFFISINGQIPMTKSTAQYKFKDAIFLGQNLTGTGPVTYIQKKTTFSLNITGKVNRSQNKPKLEISSVEYSTHPETIDFKLGSVHLVMGIKSNPVLEDYVSLIFTELNAGYSNMYTDGFRNISNAIFSQLDYDKLFQK